MRNLKLLFFSSFLLFPGILFAQYSGFDLSKYKLPDIKLDRLDAAFNLGNDLSRYYSRVSLFDTSESRYNHFQGSLNLGYFHFRNSEKYQGDLSVSATSNTTRYKNRSDDYYAKTNHSGINLQISSTNRFYYQKRNFLEADPEVLLSSSLNKIYDEQISMPTYDNSENLFTASFSLPLLVGHGRIEPIQDARLAIYIIEELNKAGRINSLPQDNVILDMAKEISKIKRQRFFDSRIRKIKELQVIDSFLVANNVISSDDIRYFAVLNDQWDYASGPVRYSGFALNAGIDDRFLIKRSGQLNSSSSSDPVKTKIFANNYNIAGFIQARYYKPVNLYWQTSASLKSSYGFEITENPLDKTNPLKNYRNIVFTTNLEYAIQFLPNSRTSTGLNFSGNYRNSGRTRSIPDPGPVNLRINDNFLYFKGGFDMYYYISPRVRLNLNADLYYTDDDASDSIDNLPAVENIDHSFQHNFTITFNYSFF